MVVIPYLVQCQGNALLKHPLTLKILTLSISVYCILLSLNLFIHSIQCITPEATGSFIQEMAQCYATDFRDIEIVNTLSFYLFILLMHHPVCIGEINTISFFLFIVSLHHPASLFIYQMVQCYANALQPGAVLKTHFQDNLTTDRKLSNKLLDLFQSFEMF